MTLKESIITLIIMLSVLVPVLFFGLSDVQTMDNNDAIEKRYDKERIEMELKKEAIYKEINKFH